MAEQPPRRTPVPTAYRGVRCLTCPRFGHERLFAPPLFDDFLRSLLDQDDAFRCGRMHARIENLPRILLRECTPNPLATANVVVRPGDEIKADVVGFPLEIHLESAHPFAGGHSALGVLAFEAGIDVRGESAEEAPEPGGRPILLPLWDGAHGDVCELGAKDRRKFRVRLGEPQYAAEDYDSPPVRQRIGSLISRQQDGDGAPHDGYHAARVRLSFPQELYAYRAAVPEDMLRHKLG